MKLERTEKVSMDASFQKKFLYFIEIQHILWCSFELQLPFIMSLMQLNKDTVVSTIML